jgi:hypothetical protein
MPDDDPSGKSQDLCCRARTLVELLHDLRRCPELLDHDVMLVLLDDSLELRVVMPGLDRESASFTIRSLTSRMSAWLCAPFSAWDSFIVTLPSFGCEASASPKKRL